MKKSIAFGLVTMLLFSSQAYSADDAASTPIIKELWPVGTKNSSTEVSERVTCPREYPPHYRCQCPELHGV